MSGEKDYPIPNRLNALLVILVFSLLLSLLLLASLLPYWYSVPLGIVFSFVFLTNYALMHEGSHQMLQSNPFLNWMFGAITGSMFPASFTMMQVTHIVHHCGNRTDHEMFDCYYEGDNLIVKYAQWYSILLGLFWIIIPIGSVIIAFSHRILHTKPFKNSRSSSILFDDFSPGDLRKMKVEVLIAGVFYFCLFNFFGLEWIPTIILFACAAFNWSTRQYVTHAWSERDVINGAHNLKVSRIMKLILLNGNWDLVHHQNSHLPWIYLSEKKFHTRESIPFLSQYLSLWAGPRPATQGSPEVLAPNDPVLK